MGLSLAVPGNRLFQQFLLLRDRIFVKTFPILAGGWINNVLMGHLLCEGPTVLKAQKTNHKRPMRHIAEFLPKDTVSLLRSEGLLPGRGRSPVLALVPLVGKTQFDTLKSLGGLLHGAEGCGLQ